jgi:transcription antitermination protein NusB
MTSTRGNSSRESEQPSSNGLRRRSREMALQLLFQTEFAVGGLSGSSVKDMPRKFVEDFQIEPKVADYGTQLFYGVTAQLSEIDSTIQASSSHWKVSRMGLVDLMVMRIAVYELKFMDSSLSPSIAIDEAVEIAKKYGSTDSGPFVNGILDQVAKS